MNLTDDRQERFHCPIFNAVQVVKVTLNERKLSLCVNTSNSTGRW